MTATSHSLAGASLAKLIPNPYLAIPLALFSNFALDFIPHWDTGTGWHHRPKIITFLITGLDVFVGLVLSWWLFSSTVNPRYLLIVIFAATLPDWIEAPYIFLNWDFPPFNWLYRVQSRFHGRDGTIRGVVTQIVVILPLVWLALSG